MPARYETPRANPFARHLEQAPPLIAEFVGVISDEIHGESGESIQALAALERARQGG